MPSPGRQPGYGAMLLEPRRASNKGEREMPGAIRARTGLDYELRVVLRKTNPKNSMKHKSIAP